MDMDLTRPRTITRLSLKDPITEVCLNNGTILRQTYIGNTPTVYDSSDTDSTTWMSGLSLPAQGINENSPDTVKEVNDVVLRNKLGSPYTVIESSSYAQSNSKKKLDINEADDKLIDDSCEVKEDLHYTSVTEETNNTLSTNDNFDNQHSLSYISSIDQSLNCKSVSNDAEFSENIISNTDEDFETNFMESEVHPETDFIEDSINESAILLGESATHYNNESLILLGESATHYDTDIKMLAQRRKTLPSFTEFPKIGKEKMDKVEYLTPNEVKAMQNARRKRVEWEQKIKKKVTSPIEVDENLEFKTDHYDNDADIEATVSKCLNEKVLKKSTPNTKHLSNDNSGSTSKKTKTFYIKNLFKSQLSSTEELSNNKTNTPSRSSDFKDNDLTTCNAKSTLSNPLSKVDSRTEGSTFHKQKLIGHRRLKSAPNYVAKNLNTDSPKVINELPLQRNNKIGIFKRRRSHSFGIQNNEQKELSEMAEAVCKEDRMDSERDDPEVLQVYY